MFDLGDERSTIPGAMPRDSIEPAWSNFPRVLCERWSHGNVALMGDAAAAAQFSIASGSKLALESAIAPAEDLLEKPSLAEALAI